VLIFSRQWCEKLEVLLGIKEDLTWEFKNTKLMEIKRLNLLIDCKHFLNKY